MGMLDDFRAKHPAYKDVPDARLADGLYNKFYAGKMDRAAFDAKVGLAPAPAAAAPALEAVPDGSGGFAVPVDTGFPSLAASMPPAAPPEDQPVGQPIDVIGQGLVPFADELSGALYGAGAALTGGDFTEAYTIQRDKKRAAYEDYVKRNPGKSVALELLGAGVGALAAPIGAGAKGIAQMMGYGGAMGGAAAAGSSDAETLDGRLQAAVPGAVTGAAAAGALGALGKGASRVTERFFGGPGVTQVPKGAPKPKYQQQVELLRKEGVPLTLGQRTGNVAAKTLDETVAPSLMGTGVRATFDEQATKVQSRLMQKAGFEPADVIEGVIDDQVIARTKQRFARRYGKALAGTEVDLGRTEIVDRLAAVETAHSALLDFEQLPKLRDAIDGLLSKAADGKITGEAYQRLRSNLGRRAKNARTKDPAIADLYKDLQKTLDDAFMDAADPATAKAKTALDRKYRNFKAMEKVAKLGGQGVSSGQLPFASLNRAAEYGTQDFKDLSRAASAVFGSGTPNSGTPTRLLGLNLDTLAAQGGRLGIATGQKLGLGRGPSPTSALLGERAAIGAVPAFAGVQARHAQIAETLMANPDAIRDRDLRRELGITGTTSKRTRVARGASTL